MITKQICQVMVDITMHGWMVFHTAACCTGVNDPWQIAKKQGHIASWVPIVAWAASAVDQPGQRKSVACAKGSEGGTGTSTDECGARQAGERAEEAAPRLTLSPTPTLTLTLTLTR